MPHDNWNVFAEEMDDVGLLSKPGCWSSDPDLGEYQDPEILKYVSGGEESGAGPAVESVIHQPSISEVTLGHVSAQPLHSQGAGLRGAGTQEGPTPYPALAEPAPLVCVRAGFESGGS